MVSHNLPQQATAFIGRDRELRAIAERLADPACRLLTWLGPGGIGKTRLAIQAATSQPAHFVNGIAFVALAPVVSPDFLAAAIGGALEMPFWGAEEPLSQLIQYLRDKQMLLVMDNVEHLWAGIECLSVLLQAASYLYSRAAQKVTYYACKKCTFLALVSIPVTKYCGRLSG